MFKTISVLQRNPDLTSQQFRDMYENDYANRAIDTMSKYIVDYRRNYIIRTLDDSRIPQTKVRENEFPYDCVTEFWFKDEDAFRAMAEASAKVIASQGNDAGLWNLRKFMRSFVVEECRSNLSGTD